MTTKDTAYHTITELVHRFDEQKDSYKRTEYNQPSYGGILLILSLKLSAGT
ncbi:MAG: hypothetical protein ICV65_07025 [Flavisolibacter sp.]|nr:hypothetical protein [Flavisolibacter sp.]